MKAVIVSKKCEKLVSDYLTCLPHKILKHRHSNGLIDYILYQLCQEYHLDIECIGYFVYNPDFHLCKGIAGIRRSDCHLIKDELNDYHDTWTTLHTTDFNKKIKEFIISTQNELFETVINKTKEQESSFSMAETFDLPNNNKGIIICSQPHEEVIEHLQHATHFIGLCPIN